MGKALLFSSESWDTEWMIYKCPTHKAVAQRKGLYVSSLKWFAIFPKVLH